MDTLISPGPVLLVKEDMFPLINHFSSLSIILEDLRQSLRSRRNCLLYLIIQSVVLYLEQELIYLSVMVVISRLIVTQTYLTAMTDR